MKKSFSRLVERSVLEKDIERVHETITQSFVSVVEIERNNFISEQRPRARAVTGAK